MGNADLIKRLRKFLDERAKMKGITPEIHSLQMGTDRQAQLTVDDLEQAIASLEVHEWRTDMENAPRDGTEILVFSHETVEVAWWVGYWQGDPSPIFGAPTHWKPLDTLPDTQVKP